MFNITLSPPQTEIAIKPGKSFTQAYSITNNSNQVVTLTTSVKEWIPQGNQSQIVFLDENNPNISFSLLNADLKLGQSFVIPPGGQKQIVLKVSIGAQAISQDSYFTFFVSQFDTSSSTTVGASGQIGAHLLISTSTNLNQSPKFSLKNLQVFPKIKDVFLTPLTFQIEIDNQTEFFQKPVGNLVIQKSGQDFKTLPLDSQNILANRSRLVYCQDNPSCTIKGPLWPGPYTAQIKLENYASPLQTFLVLPISPLITIILLLFVYLLTKKKNKYKHNTIPL